MAEPTTLVIVPALIMGTIIGLIELFFVHSDEQSMGILWLTHGLHAVPFAIIFVFINMNVEWAAGLLGFKLTQSIYVEAAVRIVIGLLAMVKVASAAALVRGSMIGEKMIHSLMIGVLVAVSPYLAPFIITPLCKAVKIPYCGV